MKQILRRIFLENLGLKVVALALACVLWLYVQGERRRDAVTGALVKLTLIPPRGKVLTVDPVDKLTVTLRGPRAAVQKIMAEGIDPIEIDLSGRAQGPLRFTSDMLNVPRGLSVESIHPPQIDVTWEDRAVRVLPLVPRFSGKPMSGYRVSRIDVTPKEAEVSGPKSQVAGLEELELKEIRLDGRDQTFETTAPVKLSRKFLQVRPEAARVWVELTAEVITRRFARVPVRVVHVPEGLEVEVTPEAALALLLEGPAPLLMQVDPATLALSIDLKEIGDVKPGSYLRPARVAELPKGIRAIATTPTSFAVTVRRKGGTGNP